MNIHLIRSLLCFLGCSVALWSQEAPDYWPLQVGNKWVYSHRQRTQDGERLPDETVTLKVVSRQHVDGQDYFQLSNGQLLRKDNDGNILERNRFMESAEPEFIIFDVTHLDDPKYRFLAPYTVFPPTLGHSQPATSPTPRFASTNIPRWLVLYQTVPAETFQVIQFGLGSGLAEMINVYLAESVGVVFSETVSDLDDFDSYELVEYRVGGAEDPTLDVDETYQRLDFNRNGKINLDDLFFFADQFGTQQGDENWDAVYDLDASGEVDFPDFFFVADFYADNLWAQTFDEERHFE